MSSILGPICVGALIRNDRGRVFVQRRSLTRRVAPGIWAIVGGHLETGESLEEALAREIKEETGWHLRRIGALIGCTTVLFAGNWTISLKLKAI